ncbi:MAG: hypothetical protein M9894_01610 [Planctomycetes bacterium]|nr:hypothetical protein [Planctomycetota bacterium]
MERFAGLPGHDLVRDGLADLARREETVAALLVSIGAPRLRGVGIDVPAPLADPERRLYLLLAREDQDPAHGRYNALVRRLISFEQAAECASWRPGRKGPGEARGATRTGSFASDEQRSRRRFRRNLLRNKAGSEAACRSSRPFAAGPLADAGRVRAFLRELGAAQGELTRVYLTGGATAVLVGWRASTVDVDLVFAPDRDALLRALPRLKERLQLNVELASPAHFIPELPGWEARSLFVGREGALEVYHYDPYAQALAKVERGHARDHDDVRELVARGLVDPARARALFLQIEPQLYRYPALDPRSFRAKVEAAFGPLEAGPG